MVNSRIRKWLRYYEFKLIKESKKVLVSLYLTKFPDAIMMNTYEISLSLFTKPILPHDAATLFDKYATNTRINTICAFVAY